MFTVTLPETDIFGPGNRPSQKESTLPHVVTTAFKNRVGFFFNCSHSFFGGLTTAGKMRKFSFFPPKKCFIHDIMYTRFFQVTSNLEPQK